MNANLTDEVAFRELQGQGQARRVRRQPGSQLQVIIALVLDMEGGVGGDTHWHLQADMQASQH
jgi:hypothetical protein